MSELLSQLRAAIKTSEPESIGIVKEVIDGVVYITTPRGVVEAPVPNFSVLVGSSVTIKSGNIIGVSILGTLGIKYEL